MRIVVLVLSLTVILQACCRKTDSGKAAMPSPAPTPATPLAPEPEPAPSPVVDENAKDCVYDSDCEVLQEEKPGVYFCSAGKCTTDTPVREKLNAAASVEWLKSHETGEVLGVWLDEYAPNYWMVILISKEGKTYYQSCRFFDGGSFRKPLIVKKKEKGERFRFMINGWGPEDERYAIDEDGNLDLCTERPGAEDDYGPGGCFRKAKPL